MGISQTDRLLILKTPLADDVLVVNSFFGSEGVSELFEYDLVVLADVREANDGKVAVPQIMGHPMTVSMALPSGSKRYFNGIVSRFSAGEVSERFATYRVRLVPTVWMLTLSSNSRIFQGMSIPDVISKVFKDSGITEFKMQLTRKYTVWDYCVQYRETDWNFISRLMEEEGIWYHFEHADGSHKLVLTDQPTSYTALPELDTAFIDIHPLVEDEDTVASWELRNELFTGKWTIRDHHFELPGKNLEAELTAKQPFDPVKKTAFYDFPGSHAQRFNKTGERLGDVKPEGDAIVKLRMEEAESARTLVEGDSFCRAFSSGFKFKIDSRTLQRASGSYVLTSVQHSAQQLPGYDSDGGEGGGYRNRFTCVPSDVPLRPARVTSKPMIHGLQSAEVVADTSGEEIWPDKYGRVKVKFPWDRDEKPGCWVQVAQQRAGKSGGQIWIPRVGDEVMVAYMEGDPDCPVIVGSVYNAANMPPYPLPDNKTQSGIKTRSSNQGGSADYNELRFEDKKGSEEILLHAQKQLTTEVEADEFRTVGANRTTTIQKDDKRINKEGDEITIIEKGSKGTAVKKDWELVVQEGMALMMVEKGDFHVAVTKGVYETQVDEGDMAVEVTGGNYDTLVGKGNMSVELDQGNLSTNVKMGNMDTKVGMGNYSVKVDLGKTAIEAMQGIELKCGSNSIKIDQTGITIKGLMVKVEGSVQTSIKGLMTEVKGDAMLQAKGAITMIG